METNPTVRVTPVAGYTNAYWLIWEKEVNSEDLSPAFSALTAALDAAKEPVYVIVDLRADPKLPLAQTVAETMGGPFRHPNMGEWLVIGQNWRAEMIANVITQVGLRSNIKWFKTEEDAMAYLATLTTVQD